MTIPALLLVLLYLFHAGTASSQETSFKSIEDKVLDRIKEARGHARQERYSRALSDLQAAVALAKQADRAELTLALALHNMAEVYRLQGKSADAVKAYDQALQIYTELDHKPAIAITETQIDAVRPDSAKQRPGKAKVASTRNRIDQAVERIRKRLGSNEPSKSTPPTPPSRMAPGSIELSKSSPRSGLERGRASYAELVKQTVNRGWRYPPSAKGKHQEGSVEVEFVILRNGELESIRILQSSGFLTLDMESIRSIRDAAPFSPSALPEGQQQTTLRLLFNYELPKTDPTKLKVQATPPQP